MKIGRARHQRFFFLKSADFLTDFYQQTFLSNLHLYVIIQLDINVLGRHVLLHAFNIWTLYTNINGNFSRPIFW